MDLAKIKTLEDLCDKQLIINNVYDPAVKKTLPTILQLDSDSDKIRQLQDDEKELLRKMPYSVMRTVTRYRSSIILMTHIFSL